MKNKTNLLLLALCLFSNMLFAQEAEMADTLRGNGKIYVVVAILLVIFAGLIGYMIYTDLKVTKLEERIK